MKADREFVMYSAKVGRLVYRRRTLRSLSVLTYDLTNAA